MKDKNRSIFDEYPTHFTHVNKVSLAYQDMGDRQGVPVVLIMGLGAQLIYWGDPFVRGLVEDGYRIILMDNRDSGLSERFEWFGQPDLEASIRLAEQGLPVESPYTIHDMAGDVTALMDHLHISSAHIVGCSMGGMIGQVVAATYPERVCSLVNLMTSARGLLGNPTVWSLPQSLSDIIPAPGASKKETVAFGLKFWKYSSNQPEGHFDEDFALDLLNRDYNRSHGWAGWMRQLVAVDAGGNRDQLLKQIRVPSLVIHGDRDPILPPDQGRELAEMIPGSVFLEVQGMGHAHDPVFVPGILKAMKNHFNGAVSKSCNRNCLET